MGLPVGTERGISYKLTQVFSFTMPAFYSYQCVGGWLSLNNRNVRGG